MSPFARRCAPLRPHPRARCASRRPQPLARCGSGWRRHRVTAGLRRPAFAGRPGGLIVGRGGRGEPVFAGRCGLGAASSLRMRLWRRIFASEPVVAPHLRFIPCRGVQPLGSTPHRDGRFRSCLPAAPSPLPVRTWWRRVHFLSPVVHFAHTRDAPSTAPGDIPRRGYRPWPGKPSRRACMSTVPGRDASPGRNPQPGAHTIAAISGRKAPEPFGIAELNLNKILTRPGHLLFLSDY
jgi:hypothetical protein